MGQDVLPLAPRDARRKGSMPQYSMRAASASARGTVARGGAKAEEEHGGGGQWTSRRSEEGAPHAFAHARGSSVQPAADTSGGIARPRTGNVVLKRLCVEDLAEASEGR